MGLVTVKETLKDSLGNNLVGYLNISNPAFLSPDGSALNVSAATNASPIEITTSASHGLSTGNTVYITGVGGNTAANGTFTVTVVDADQFTLDESVGNGAYTTGGTVQKLIPVGAKTTRHPTSGNFPSGLVDIDVYPTTTAIAVPGGAAAGFTYYVEYFLTDGSQYAERWNVAATPASQTVSGVRSPGTVNPTASIALSQLAPSSAELYDVIAYTGSAWARYGAHPQSIFTSTAAATVANTVTETTLAGTGVGTLTIPANWYKVGKTLKVFASGVYSNTGTPTIRIKLKHGATILVDTGAVTTTTGATNWQWTFEGYITCRTVGGTGTVILQGDFYINTSATAVARYAMTATATITIDTTVTNVLDLTVTWGTASASNTITCSNFLAHAINNP